jgi:uncharacterized protein YgbK (DUF1537 family)
MGASLAEIVILADDLSGAAEAAAMLAPGAPHGIAVLLASGTIGTLQGPIVLDTDSRYAPPEEAFRTVADVLSLLPAGRLILKKVDSLLRGNFAAEVSAIARSRRTVVFAPALPRLNRVVRDGRPLVDGAPLRATASWRMESGAAPSTLTEALPDSIAVPLATVRKDGGLRRALVAAEPGSVLVCDAETDADLDRITAAAIEARRDGDVALAGSSALASAVARLLGTPADSEDFAGALSRDGRAAFVVGTGEPRARAQVEELRERGAHVLTLDPLHLVAEPTQDDMVAATVAALSAPVSVVTLESGTGVDAGSGGLLSRRLAELVATACAASPPALLTLTGGATARAVLDALGIRRITVLGTVSEGAALSTTDAGGTVVTRPGSFGRNDDFLRILERVAPTGYATLRSRTTERHSE